MAEELKTLLDATPREFLAQTNKIRKALSRWITETDLLAIRQRIPQYVTVGKDATAEERADAIRANAEKQKKQRRENLEAMLQAILEDHPEETLEILSLSCFVEPKDVDNYPIRDYLLAFTKMLTDEVTVSFFSSLWRLDRMDTSISART